MRKWHLKHGKDGELNMLPPVHRSKWDNIRQLSGLSAITESDKAEDSVKDDTRSHLRSFTQKQQSQFARDLLALAKKKAEASAEMKKFLDWLDNRKGHPFTVVLDGANTPSLRTTVAKLENAGEYPLVIVPQRFVAMDHNSSATFMNERSAFVQL